MSPNLFWYVPSESNMFVFVFGVPESRSLPPLLRLSLSLAPVGKREPNFRYFWPGEGGVLFRRGVETGVLRTLTGSSRPHPHIFACADVAEGEGSGFHKNDRLTNSLRRARLSRGIGLAPWSRARLPRVRPARPPRPPAAGGWRSRRRGGRRRRGRGVIAARAREERAGAREVGGRSAPSLLRSSIPPVGPGLRPRPALPSPDRSPEAFPPFLLGRPPLL